MNNSGPGAIKPKPSESACSFVRSIGYQKTMKAFDNRTRSGHTATSKHYQYESAGSGLGGNVLGYGKHGGGSHSY